MLKFGEYNEPSMVKDMMGILKPDKYEDRSICLNMFDIINEIFNDFIKHHAPDGSTFNSKHINESIDTFVYKHNDDYLCLFIGEIIGDKYIISFDPYTTWSRIIIDDAEMFVISDYVLKDKELKSLISKSTPEELIISIFAKYLDPYNYTDIEHLELYKTKILRQNMTESDLEKIWQGVR